MKSDRLQLATFRYSLWSDGLECLEAACITQDEDKGQTYNIVQEINADKCIMLAAELTAGNEHINSLKRCLWLAAKLNKLKALIEIHGQELMSKAEIRARDYEYIRDDGLRFEEGTSSYVYRKIQSEMNHLRSKYAPPMAEITGRKYLYDLCREAIALYEDEIHASDVKNEDLLSDGHNGDMTGHAE